MPALPSRGLKGIPCLIQEQNSHAGVTNKWLSKHVKVFCSLYWDGAILSKDKIVFTGNPVRQDLLELIRKEESKILQPFCPIKNLVGFGWKFRCLDQWIDPRLAGLFSTPKTFKWYGNVERITTKFIRRIPSRCASSCLLDRMDLAYAAADFIISRSGALSVSELSLVGKPVLFIPSPNVAEDHQTKNAAAIVKEAAALMIPEKDLDAHLKLFFQNDYGWYPSAAT